MYNTQLTTRLSDYHSQCDLSCTCVHSLTSYVSHYHILSIMILVSSPKQSPIVWNLTAPSNPSQSPTPITLPCLGLCSASLGSQQKWALEGSVDCQHPVQKASGGLGLFWRNPGCSSGDLCQGWTSGDLHSRMCWELCQGWTSGDLHSWMCLELWEGLAAA